MKRSELAILERVAVTPLADRREFAEALAEADEAALGWLLESPMIRPAWRRKAIDAHLAKRQALHEELKGVTKLDDLTLRLRTPGGPWQCRMIQKRLRELRREKKAARQAKRIDPDGPAPAEVKDG
jgi:hypothetical protein